LKGLLDIVKSIPGPVWYIALLGIAVLVAESEGERHMAAKIEAKPPVICTTYVAQPPVILPGEPVFVAVADTQDEARLRRMADSVIAQTTELQHAVALLLRERDGRIALDEWGSVDVRYRPPQADFVRLRTNLIPPPQELIVQTKYVFKPRPLYEDLIGYAGMGLLGYGIAAKKPGLAAIGGVGVGTKITLNILDP
jgi:hypothetical protein